MRQFVCEDRRYFNYGKGFVFNKLLELFRGKYFFNGHRLLAFDARKIVEVAPDVIAASFMEVDAIFDSDNQIVEMSCCDLCLLQFDGTLHDGLPIEGEALGLQGTEEAVGVFRGALQRAEFHHCLIV